MLKHFYQTIVWTFRRNKSYGILNMAGLAVGIASAVFIFLWVEDELTYNHEFKNRDHLYKVMQTMNYSGKTNVFPASPPVLAEHIQEEIPEVVNVVRMTWSTPVAMSLDDDKPTFETGYYCDPSFFSMFSVQFVNGNPDDAFRDVSSIVLTEKTAAKFFPAENPVGKTLKIDGGKIYTVTAVVKEFPENVSFRFDWLIPFQVAQTWLGTGWTANSVETIVELHPSANIETVNGKLVHLLQSRRGNDMIGAFLFNMNDWRLYSDFDDQGQAVGGEVKTIRLFTLIAFIIIVLACINFMNLATAGAMKRAKEVGVLKAIGVRKMALIRRFLGETMVQAFFSLVLSIWVVVSFMPVFNQLVSKQLSLNFFTAEHILAFVAIFLFCGLLSGAYPAFFLSSFKAVDVLKGLKLPGSKGTSAMRKALVVFQFSVSICLLVCILVMFGQFLHTRNRDWGYSKEGVVTVPMNDVMLKHTMVILQETRSLSAVESAGISGDILSVQYKRGDFQWQGKDNEMELPVCIMDGITGVLSLMGIELEAGRDFAEIAGLEQGNVIINQRMAQIMGEEGRIDGTIRLFEQNYQIIGIAKDHVFNNYQALRSEPLVMFCGLGQNRNYRMYIKLADGKNISSAMQSIETIVKPYITGKPFEYTVLEERVSRMMQGDLFIAKLLTGFSVIAVLISCIGLLGLIAFAAEQRTREIGIRKVFGASVFQMVMLLTKDFLKLVLIACIIAFPVAWWVMKQWLNNFEYRIGLYWWIFALAGVMAVVIAWATVSVQAYKAATANPVKAIKSE